MPAKRSAMRKIKEVLRLKFEARLSHERNRGGERPVKGAVSKYVQRAISKSLSWPLPEDLDDTALSGCCFPRSCSASTSCTPTTPMCTRNSSAKG